jgi:biotin operon repressor
MSDNKSKQDGRDRSQVSSDESYELSYLEEKLGVSRAQVREAIEAVGNSREKVEEYLKRK